MFPNQNEAYRFFDINHNQRVTKEHFAFTCAFMHIDHKIQEVVELFHLIDYKGDGVIDESEFSSLFQGMEGTWNSHEFNICKSIVRDITDDYGNVQPFYDTNHCLNFQNKNSIAK